VISGLFAPFLFSIFYFTDIYLRASAKYFWYDELFTVYFARLPDLSSLWRALNSGVDFNPPPFYLLTRASTWIFGENLLSVRLPEILGFWVFTLCLYRFASCRFGTVAGSIAMLFPMVTGVYYYAYEARPHAIVLGFCGVSLLAWQKCMEGSSRSTAAHVWFALALLGAFLMHCFALCLIGPFALVEIARTMKRKSIDWRNWLALGVPVILVLPMYSPLLRSFQKLSSGTTFAHVSLAGWSQVGGYYRFLFDPCTLVMVVILLLFALNFSITGAHLPSSDAQGVRLEQGLAIAFTTLPILGVLLAKAVHGPFFNRYFLSAVAGLALCLALSAGQRPRSSRLGLAVVATLGLALAISFSRMTKARLGGSGGLLIEPSSRIVLNTTPGQPLARHMLLAAERSNLPIGVSSPLDFVYLVHYAPSLRERLFFVAADGSDFAYAGFGRFLRSCKIQFNSPVLYNQFERSHGEYLLYGSFLQANEMALLASSKSHALSTAVEADHFLARFHD